MDAAPSPADAQQALQALQGLALPPERVQALLTHVKQFCHAHGGERHYAELLSLVARLQAAPPAP